MRHGTSGLLAAFLLFLPTQALAHAGGAVPGDVWTHWNFDWLLLITWVVPLLLYVRGAMSYPLEHWRIGAFFMGMAALFVALISPLDAVSESLFAAHMVQHLLLMLVAAPLLVVSRPLAPLLRGLPKVWRKTIGMGAHHPTLQGVWATLTGFVTVIVLHIGTIWLWHVPTLYSAALRNETVHIVEHISFFVPAALYWWMIVNRDHFGGRILSLFSVMMASGLLGALMTFASAPWYADHAPYVAAWGLTPLDDQQLAGLFMWIPAGMLYAAIAAMLLGAWLRTVEQRTLKRERRWLKELGDA